MKYEIILPVDKISGTNPPGQSIVVTGTQHVIVTTAFPKEQIMLCYSTSYRKISL